MRDHQLGSDSTLRRDDNDGNERPEVVKHQVWIDHDWHARVDQYGQVLGACAEGALGFIIQLYPASKNNSQIRAALKIPRLREDTLEQNANICKLLIAESIAVGQVNRPGQFGLIRATTFNYEKLMTLRALRQAPDEDAHPQDGCGTFIAFGKTNRIRLCNIKIEKGEIVVFPNTEELRREFAFLADHPDIWKFLENDGDDRARSFDEPRYLEITQRPQQRDAKSRPAPTSPVTTDKTELKVGSLIPTLETVRSTVTWYVGVPSIMFDWAAGTLQQAIRLELQKRWSIEERYSLIENVMMGLVELHAREILHGDIRPANIMAVGDLTQASRYALGDYGSFLADQPQPSNHQSDGYTSAPGITRHRTSTFYSRERRGGIEHEDATVAILLTKQSLMAALGDRAAEIKGIESLPEDEYFLRLDLKYSVVKPETNEVLPNLYIDMANDWLSMRQIASAEGNAFNLPKASTSQPTEGVSDPTKATPALSNQRLSDSRNDLTDSDLQLDDQIRIRDLVFTIVAFKKQKASDRPYFSIRCRNKHNRVLMEKIAVRSDEENLFGTQAGRFSPHEAWIMDLPKWVAIRQTSVASDLFSIGVLALYLFHADEAAKNDPERALSSIVQRLEDENLFLLVFGKLSIACTRIEEAFTTHKPAASLIEEPSSNPSLVPTKKFADDVLDLTHEIVNTIAPELKSIAERFDNKAHFLLFVHFILSCIHRKSHLNTEAENGDYPFCVNRREQPKGSKSAKKALARISQLRLFIESINNFFVDFEAVLEKHQYQWSVSRSAPLLPAGHLDPQDMFREQKGLLEQKLSQQESLLKRRDEEMAELRARLPAAQDHLKEVAELEQKLSQQESLLKRRGEEMAQLHARLSTAQNHVKGMAELEQKLSQQESLLKRRDEEMAQLHARLTAAQDYVSEMAVLTIRIKELEVENEELHQTEEATKLEKNKLLEDKKKSEDEIAGLVVQLENLSNLRLNTD